MGKSLWLLASVLAISYGTQLTNLITLCPTKSLVYVDTSSLIIQKCSIVAMITKERSYHENMLRTPARYARYLGHPFRIKGK